MGKNRRRSGEGSGDSNQNERNNIKSNIEAQLQLNPDSLENIEHDLNQINEKIGEIDEYLDLRADGVMYNTTVQDFGEQVDVRRSIIRMRDKLLELRTAHERMSNEINQMVSENTTRIDEDTTRFREYMSNLNNDITDIREYLLYYYPNTYASMDLDEIYI